MLVSKVRLTVLAWISMIFIQKEKIISWNQPQRTVYYKRNEWDVSVWKFSEESHFRIANWKAFSKMPLTRSTVQCEETETNDGMLENEKKAFVYDKDDEFYSAPAFCHLLHYRNAAIFCGILEILLIVVAILLLLSKCDWSSLRF